MSKIQGYAFEQCMLAGECMATSGAPLKDRLANAYTSRLDRLQTCDVPELAREALERLRKQLSPVEGQKPLETLQAWGADQVEEAAKTAWEVIAVVLADLDDELPG